MQTTESTHTPGFDELAAYRLAEKRGNTPAQRAETLRIEIRTLDRRMHDAYDFGGPAMQGELQRLGDQQGAKQAELDAIA